MPITAQRLRGEIRFTISGKLCQHISDWEFAVDEQVFNEQLNTGLFRGRPLDNDDLKIMQMVKERGGIAPYYSAGGSRGTCVYSLRVTDAGNVLKVEHSEAGASVEFEDTLSRPREPEAVTPIMIFKIDEQEYKNLRRWKYWSDHDALTPRYIYRFGRVSLGRLGYMVKVEDTSTGNKIDVTNYKDW
jgi:hypothetical protein